MDARLNPYTPGDGARPVSLAGRHDLLQTIERSLDRSRAGFVADNLLLVGLHGSGKTVLLGNTLREAMARGLQTVAVRAIARSPLPALLLPQFRALLVRLQQGTLPANRLQEAAAVLADFSKLDIAALLTRFATLIQTAGSSLWFAIDDLQNLDADALATLMAALARVRQQQLPVMLLGASLPTVLDGVRTTGMTEKLLSQHTLEALSDAEAAQLLITPAAQRGVKFELSALGLLVGAGAGSPSALQQLGHAAWDAAASSPIRLAAARAAIPAALAELDAGFFQRFDRLTPPEKVYLRTLAELGPGAHRSGNIAARLQRKVTVLAPIRSSLIVKGLLYSPLYGDTAFTTPLYEGFLLRNIT